MAELKQCPFCGGDVNLSYRIRDNTFLVRHVYWSGCAFIDPFKIDGSMANSLTEAYGLWNRRADNAKG